MKILTGAGLMNSLLVIPMLFGCNMSNAKVSKDIVKLKELVTLDVPITSAQWEVFGTPEYTGGVPGPTDYITLVAELQLTEPSQFQALPALSGKQFLVPEANRAWLSSVFRHALTEKGTSASEFPPTLSCKRYTSTVRKSSRAANGFLCHDGKSYLLYLTLSART